MRAFFRVRDSAIMPYSLMQLRRAQPNDALAVARVHVRSWQRAYRGLLPDSYLDSLDVEARAARYDFSNPDPRQAQTILAVSGDASDDAILGLAMTSAARDLELSDYGELGALYVDPDYWGRGIGTTLIAAARDYLYGLGFRKAYLWLLAGNALGERFYRKDGWFPDGRSQTQTVNGVLRTELRYQRDLEGQDLLSVTGADRAGRITGPRTMDLASDRFSESSLRFCPSKD